MTEIKSFNWKCLAGNLEGLVSLLCLLFLGIATTGVGYWLMVIVFSLGFGLGIGAMRFGNLFGKICGGFSVGVLSLLIILGILVKLSKLTQ